MATPETELKLAAKKYLKMTGWFVRHNLQRRYSYKGMPDIIATKYGITLEIEFKSTNGKQSPEQEQYQEDLEDHGGHYVLAYSVQTVANYIQEYNL